MLEFKSKALKPLVLRSYQIKMISTYPETMMQKGLESLCAILIEISYNESECRDLSLKLTEIKT